MALSSARPREADSAQMKQQHPQLPEELAQLLWDDQGLVALIMLWHR
jgi:hypothetical protein